MQPQRWTNKDVLKHQNPFWLSRKDFFFFSSPPLIRRHISRQTLHPSLHKAIMGSMFRHATWHENKRAFTSEAESRRVRALRALKVWHEASPSPAPLSLEAPAHTKHRQLLFYSALCYISHPATLHSLPPPLPALCPPTIAVQWAEGTELAKLQAELLLTRGNKLQSAFVFKQHYHWIWNVRWLCSFTYVVVLLF